MIKHRMFSARLFFMTVALAVSMLASQVRAQQQQDSVINEIEGLFAEEERSEIPRDSGRAQPRSSGTSQKEAEIRGVSDLRMLQPFDDVAVIQKRFLPKSNRFEFYIGPALNLNDAFFFSVGADARLGYYFSERYGLEFVVTYLSTSERQVTADLFQRGVKTSSFVSPRGYYGLDFKWTPSYGKMTWANKGITPFDLYFSIGGGLTPTNQDKSEATLHLSTGQIFALSKASALRWDLSWFLYSSKSNIDPSGNSALYHNVLFSVGWSGFFPEAAYR